ncbi:MAG TPA: glycosyltransferase [Patescibacteria group bacterium]
MRVLFFNYEYPPLGGGAANATSYILREFSKIPDLEVDLVTSSADEKFELEKIGGNINIHKLPIGKNSKNLHYQSQRDLLVYAWKAYFFSRKLIKKNNYDLTHSFFTLPCGFLSLAYYRLYKLPYIVSLRGADVPGYSDRFPLIYALLTPLIRHIWKKADAVISNSQGLKELALKTNAGQEIGIIYNGIDIKQFRPAIRGETSNFKVICISRLTRRKGINYLIEAMEKLVQKHPDLSLQIVGEGDAKAELEKQSQGANLGSKVEFKGRIPHENLPEIYNSADVFVLPSLNEGMSNTMLEALASGLPIVATDTGGSKELISEGKNGFMIKMKDSGDIAEKLEKLIADPELARSMEEKSRAIAESMSWEKVAQNYYGLYKTIK